MSDSDIRHPPLIESMRYVAAGLKHGFPINPYYPLMVQDVVYYLEKEIERAEKLHKQLEAERAK